MDRGWRRRAAVGLAPVAIAGRRLRPAVQVVEHGRDVADRLGIGRDAPVLLDRILARVVGGEDVHGIAVALLKNTQEADAAPDVVGRIASVDAEALGGRRHELHEADRALRRDLVHAEAALGARDRHDQAWVKTFLGGDPAGERLSLRRGGNLAEAACASRGRRRREAAGGAGSRPR